MIRFNNVRSIYKNNNHVALDGVSFDIKDGEFVFIVGSSGAGKTTMTKLLLCEMTPTSGTIEVNGFNLGRYWDRGPLTALYIPGALLKEENEIVIFEADGLKGEPSVEINAVSGIDNHQPEVIV